MRKGAGLVSPAEKREIRTDYFRYLFPTVIGMAAHSCYCMADVYFVGIAVGKEGLAALNVALPVFTVYSTFSILVGVGAATTISVCRGEKREDAIDKVFTQALLCILLVGAFTSVLGTLFLEQIAYLFGATELIAGYVTDYLIWISRLSFIYLFSAMLSVIVRSDGNPRLVMAAGTTGNLVNILLDYLFVMKLGLGIFGAGLATIIGPMVTVALLSFHFFKHCHHVHLTRRFLSRELFLRMIRNGAGAGVLELSAGFVILLFNVSLIRVSGETAVAVFSVISNIAYVGKGVFNGMAQAAQPIISLSYGAKSYRRMVAVNRYAMLTALCFSMGVLFITALFPRSIIGAFVSGDAGVVSMGAAAIFLYFLSFPFTGLNTVLMYYYQSIEQVRHTIAIAILRGVVLAAAAVTLLSHFFGLNGVWLSLLVSEGITFLIFSPLKLRLDRRYIALQTGAQASERP